MAILGTYRQSGVIASTSISSSSSVINLTGFKPSGITYGNAIAVCLYVWSGTNSDGDWIPYRSEWAQT